MALRWIFGVLFALQLCGCGYTLKGSANPLAEKEGVRKIFVAPVSNSSYTPGVEHIVYNSIIKNVSAEGRVRIVRTIEDADAVLYGNVDVAEARLGATAPRQSIVPPELNHFAPDLVAEYNGVLSCSFSLEHTKFSPAAPGKRRRVWSAGFTRNFPFPASTRIGVTGATGALIDDSELARALKQMADAIGRDATESMTSVF